MGRIGSVVDAEFGLDEGRVPYLLVRDREKKGREEALPFALNRDELGRVRLLCGPLMVSG
jgi:hypothetical protein